MNIKKEQIGKWVSGSLLLLPLLVLAYWHYKNGAYPRNDEKNYTSGAIAVLEDLGHWFGLRNQKPYAVHLGVLPFLAVFRGNILRAIALEQLCAFSILIFYVYRILKRTLGQWDAALGTCLMAFIPWIMVSFHGNTSESLMFPLLAGTVFYGLEMGSFENSKTAAKCGLWLGVALCVRPVEVVLLLFPLLLLSLVRRLRELKAIQELGWALGACLPFGGLFVFSVKSKSDLWLTGGRAWVVGGWLVTLAIGLWRWKRSRNTPLAGVWNVLFPGIVLPVIWYAGFLSSLFQFTFGCSFDPESFKNASHEAGHVVRMVYPHLASYFTAALLLLALPAIRWREWGLRWWLALALFNLPIWIGEASLSNDLRYYYYSILAMNLLALGVATNLPGLLALRRTVQLGFLGLLLYFHFFTLFPNWQWLGQFRENPIWPPNWFQKFTPVDPWIPYPLAALPPTFPLAQKDPSVDLVEKVGVLLGVTPSEIPPRKVTIYPIVSRLNFNWMGVGGEVIDDYVWEHRIRGWRWSAKADEPGALVIVGPVEIQDPLENETTHTAQALLKMIEMPGELEKQGLRVKGRFQLAEIFTLEPRTYFLLEKF